MCVHAQTSPHFRAAEDNATPFLAKGSNFTSCRHCRVDVKIIKRAKKVKYLGLLIDEDIKWDEHVAYISSKIRQNLGVMEWLSNDIPLDSPVT